MNHITRNQRRQLEKANLKQSKKLTEVPKDQWPTDHGNRTRVFRSRAFLVQEYIEGGNIRLSVNSTSIDSNGQWIEGISWEDLQRIKREVGYGDSYAVEVFPKDRDIVNVSNMRHLWIPPEALNIGWIN